MDKNENNSERCEALCAECELNHGRCVAAEAPAEESAELLAMRTIVGNFKAEVGLTANAGYKMFVTRVADAKQVTGYIEHLEQSSAALPSLVLPPFAAPASQWDAIMGAVARGWCAPENERKIIDNDLVGAITREVCATLAGRCRAQGGETSLDGLTRYQDTSDYEGGYMMVPEDDGEYVLFDDVQALLAASPVAAATEQAKNAPVELLRRALDKAGLTAGGVRAEIVGYFCSEWYLAAPADAEPAQALTDEDISTIASNFGMFRYGYEQDPSGHSLRFAREIEREVLARLSKPGAQVTASDEHLSEGDILFNAVVDAATAYLEHDPAPAIMVELPDKQTFMGLGTKSDFALMIDGRSGAQIERDSQSPAPVTAEPAASIEDEGDFARLSRAELIAYINRLRTLIVAPAPADRDAIRADALEEAALLVETNDLNSAAFNAQEIRALKGQPAAAHAAPEFKPVGNFLYVGTAYEATSSDDPRGITLYRPASKAATSEGEGA
jgi:hypothetical protein